MQNGKKPRRRGGTPLVPMRLNAMNRNELLACQLLTGSFRGLNESGESGRIADGDLGEHLSVERHAGLLKTVHELRVVDAVELAGGRDSGDPEAAEIALSLTAADIGVVAGLHDSFLGHLEVLASCAPVTLSEL